MTARHFVYQTLINTPEVRELVGGDNPRIFAKKTMTSSREDHPYIVYKLGNESSEDFSEERDISRQYVQIWVHDYDDGVTADYDVIDRVITAIRAAFFQASSAVDKVWIARYIETSQDLNDDTLNTVFKYARFYLIKEE